VRDGGELLGLSASMVNKEDEDVPTAKKQWKAYLAAWTLATQR